jgi:ribosome maturation factor RimP
MPKLSEQEIFEALKNIVAGQGAELVEVKWGYAFKSNALTLFIHKKGGVTLDDCERVHNAVDIVLDEIDASDSPYTLNVSSLGLDRPIVTDADWERSLDTEIEIIFQTPIAKSKSAVGILKSVDSDSVYLDTKAEKCVKIDKANIAKARPFVRF